MGARRKARELALKAVFEFDFNQNNLSQISARLERETQPGTEVMQFMSKLLEELLNHKAQVDESIEKHSNHWKLGRMASVDRNILRLGVTEILFLDDIPKNVTINEYLEIAKKYGTEESSGFVNGILDKIKKVGDQ